MWVVFKYKKNNYDFFCKNLKQVIHNDINFYNPKIYFEKKISNKNRIKKVTKFILNGYAFCFSNIFDSPKKILEFKHTIGLEYFLIESFLNQKDIIKFINFCKKNEDYYGNLSQNFFSKLKKKKLKFLNGPFSNMIFEIIERNKNKTKFKLGELSLEINSRSKYYYLPV